MAPRAFAADIDTPAFVQRNSFGEAGLLDMPNAHMAPDGQLFLSLTATSYAQRVTLGFQILPWLEGAFRYTGIPKIASGGSIDYDRSFGVKLRLFQEGVYRPEISVGIRDLIGTGIYGSEYFVATKKIWDFDVTAGLGWGRLAGNGTFENPFASLLNSFRTRAAPTGQGGTIDFGQFFHGPDAGVFGGISWDTPIDNLHLTVEYSSDHYPRETAARSLHYRSPINLGFAYQIYSGITIGGGWFYGSALGATVSISADPTAPVVPAKLNTVPMPATLRSDEEQLHALAAMVNNSATETTNSTPFFNSVRQLRGVPTPQNIEVDGHALLVDAHASGHASDFCIVYAQLASISHPGVNMTVVTDLDAPRGKVAFCSVDQSPQPENIIPISDPIDDPAASAPPSSLVSDLKAAERQIRQDAAAQHLYIEAISIQSHQITVYYRNTHYEFETSALGRLVRVLMADAPPNVEIFRLLPVKYGHPMQDIQILRTPLERMYTTRGTMIDVHQAIGLRAAPLENPILDSGERHTYPRFSWSVSPALRQGFFDPTAPYRAQLFASLKGGVEVAPGLSLESEYQLSFYNSFSGVGPSNSVLPHVRSDIDEYITKGANGFSTLDAAYHTRVAPDIFVEAKVGYLEDVFAGAGGQILWRPEDSRWAVGADVYEVWQRNFNRLFGLQHYHVLTGHVSVYYQSPWRGINVNLHVGRYLAGDEGATIEVTRHFMTGIEVGAFATFTNVPFSRFGEGSFDKGIIIHIPLEWALPFSTQSSYDLDLRPLTRDGGQRLVDDDSLYEETRRTSYDEISRNVEYVAHP